MTYDKEFLDYVNEILNNKEFIKRKKYMHHENESVYDHSLEVAYNSYLYAKKHNLNCRDISIGALLHDFYTNSDTTLYNARETLKKHPEIALENACKYFDIDEVQKDIIEKHMFPATKELPSYKESFLVSMVDKAVAAHEMYRFKLSMYLGIFIVFVCNILAIQK